MNRLTRDEILHQGLDLADLPTLDEHDRPGGRGSTIAATAHSIAWLQSALDLVHRTFPWSGLVTSTTLTVAPSGSATLPTNFLEDFRDGVTLGSPYRRLRRVSMPDLLAADPEAVGDLVAYVVTPPTLRVWRRPIVTTPLTLWYYALPPPLTANTIPQFPDDLTLVEYIHLRAKEWVGAVPPGSALAYLTRLCAALQKSGKGPQAEARSIPLDPGVFRSSPGRDAWTWIEEGP